MLNPHSNSSSASSSNSQHTSSGEASPAASHVNVATSKLAVGRGEEDYSEDSLEESTISTDLTPVKQNGVAWEIHFKSNASKRTTSGSKNTSNAGGSKKVS